MTSWQRLEPCTAPIHLWKFKSDNESWFCTECGLIVHSPDQELFKTRKQLIKETAPDASVIGIKKKKALKGTARSNVITVLAERDGLICFYCEHELVNHENKESSNDQWWPTIDHLLPRSLGGTNELDNLVLACRRCNNEKGGHVKLLATVIVRLRKKLAEKQESLEKSGAYIEHLEWELFDAGLGEFPGLGEIAKGKRRRSWHRPKSALRQIEFQIELGERVNANLRSENTGNQVRRVMAIVKRKKTPLRYNHPPHVYHGKNPRGVF